MTTIHSFDVFDTCLVRTFARPEDLFIELARRLLPASATSEAVADFARQREQAETAARRTATREDITLADIYRHFETGLAEWQLSTRLAQTVEINLEISCVRPIWSTRQRIANLRRQGQRIIFISDMYLPASVIRLMLVNHGVALPTEPVYVSGNIGLTKASGRLFDYVLVHEGISPGQLHHYGDNPRADVVSARQRSIRTVYFQESRLNRFERLTVRTGQSALTQSRLAAISRAVRLQSDRHSLSAENVHLAANIIAPLLTAYIAWVLQQARQDGFERLYFVARDGQILHAIAQKLANCFPTPELSYLYGSRQAWFLPSVFKCTFSELDWLTLHSPAPRHMLKKLNIRPEEISQILLEHQLDSWDTSLNPKQLARFWQVIQHPTVSQLILQRAAAARQLTVAYFKQAGLFDSQKWALVDVGWTLKSQRAVRRLLQTVNPAATVHGYYLGVTNARVSASESGPYRAFITEARRNQPINLPGQQLFRNINTVEQIFTIADHGSTVGYQLTEDGIQPVLTNSLSIQQQKFAANMQREACNYADEFARAGMLTEILAARYTALVGFDEFVTSPTRAEAQAIAWVPIGEDQNETRRHQLARPLTLGDLLYYAGRAAKIVSPRDFSAGHSWWAGSVVLSGWWVRVLLNRVDWVIQLRAVGGLLKIRRWWWKLTGTRIV